MGWLEISKGASFERKKSTCGRILDHRVVGWLAGGWLEVRLVGWLGRWIAGRLSGWSIGRLVGAQTLILAATDTCSSKSVGPNRLRMHARS